MTSPDEDSGCTAVDDGGAVAPKRFPGGWLPTLKKLGDAADQCRELGLRIGDTITGKERVGSWWNEAQLTLLWLGDRVAVFSVRSRSSTCPYWDEPIEVADWCLECRRWHVTPNPQGETPPAADACAR